MRQSWDHGDRSDTFGSWQNRCCHDYAWLSLFEASIIRMPCATIVLPFTTQASAHLQPSQSVFNISFPSASRCYNKKLSLLLLLSFEGLWLTAEACNSRVPKEFIPLRWKVRLKSKQEAELFLTSAEALRKRKSYLGQCWWSCLYIS